MSAFDKRIGYENIKAELMRVSDVLKDHEKYSKLGVKTPRGVLLYGEPGLGKIMILNELEKYYKIAKNIIMENRTFVDAVIEELVDKEILRKKDIQRIKEKFTICSPMYK